MTDQDPALAEALAAIDVANADDPNSFEGRPLAQHQGQRAEHWVRELDSDASDELRLAARAHHLRRWEVPRNSYPEGRAGYLKWRAAQKRRHAEDLTALLSGHRFDEETIARAGEIVSKKGLGKDPEVQVFEDAVSLTFVETQLATLADTVDDPDQLAKILGKTLNKMSPDGRAALGRIDVDDRFGPALAAASALAADDDGGVSC